MALWSNINEAESAPKYQVAGGYGVAANGQEMFENTEVGAFVDNMALGVFGLSAEAAANTERERGITTISGWALRKEGTGHVERIDIISGGAGYAPGEGFITFGGGTSGQGANATYTVNDDGNVVSIVMNEVGNTYNVTPTANIEATYNVQAELVVVMGGRANRISYESVVAAGSIA